MYNTYLLTYLLLETFTTFGKKIDISGWKLCPLQLWWCFDIAERGGTRKSEGWRY